MKTAQEIFDSKTIGDMTSLDLAWHDQQYNVERTKRELVASMKSLEGTLASARKNLEEGYNVNSLGVCQSQAHDVDRYCALYDAEKKTLAMLERLVQRAAEGK